MSYIHFTKPMNKIGLVGEASRTCIFGYRTFVSISLKKQNVVRIAAQRQNHFYLTRHEHEWLARVCVRVQRETACQKIFISLRQTNIRQKFCLKLRDL